LDNFFEFSNIEKILGKKESLMVTPCMLKELELIGQPLKFVLDKAKTFKVFKCNHQESQGAKLCLRDLIGFENENNFVVFTQDESL
jgi:rRNA-processing protein FCF1